MRTRLEPVRGSNVANIDVVEERYSAKAITTPKLLVMRTESKGSKPSLKRQQESNLTTQLPICRDFSRMEIRLNNAFFSCSVVSVTNSTARSQHLPNEVLQYLRFFSLFSFFLYIYSSCKKFLILKSVLRDEKKETLKSWIIEKNLTESFCFVMKYDRKNSEILGFNQSSNEGGKRKIKKVEISGNQTQYLEAPQKS